MTVAAWDGVTLATDSAATASNGTINRVCKVFAIDLFEKPIPYIGTPSLVLFAVTGQLSDIMRVHEFLSGKADKLDLKDKSEALIVSPEGAWLWNGAAPVPLIRDAKAAIGIGSMAALGAMFAGVDAVRAVEIACACVEACETPVQAFSLPQPQEVQNDEQGSHGTGNGGAGGTGVDHAEQGPDESNAG